MTSDRTMTECAKVLYAKDFMFKFCDCSGWVQLYEQHTERGLDLKPACLGCSQLKRGRPLLEKVGQLEPKRKKTRVVLSAAEAAAKKAAAAASGAGIQPPRTDRVPQPDVTCFSRSDPSSAGCRYTDCIFSHTCASCGEDHAASACPSWEPPKTRRRRAGIAA